MRSSDGWRGVSVMVAIITLMGLTLALASVLTLALGKWEVKNPTQTMLTLRIENEKHGKENLILIHTGGDPIPDAFELKGGKITWMNLEIRVNGVKLEVWADAMLNGEENAGVVRFSQGDELSILLPWENSVIRGDWLSVVYKPAGQTLLQSQVYSLRG